jgi:hypothetical protein
MDAISETWKLAKDTVLSFIDDEALSRGGRNCLLYRDVHCASPPLIVIAIAGLAFGRDAALVRSRGQPMTHTGSDASS